MISYQKVQLIVIAICTLSISALFSSSQSAGVICTPAVKLFVKGI